MLGAMKEELEERLAFLDPDARRTGLCSRGSVRCSSDTPIASSPPSTAICCPSRARGSCSAIPAVKERLLTKQREYLLSLVRRRVDERYVEERVRIGEVHERIGLDPRWYLGAYSLYFSLLAPVISEAFRERSERVSQTLVALVKLLMLDAQLAIEAYNERHERSSSI